MLDPYRMVVINIIGSAVILLGVLLFKIFYPKRSINLFLLLMLISILPVISIFRQGSYESGDFNIHIYRAMEFYDSLSEGNIMPSWAGELNATYGYPLFIFNYPLPYYIISLFHFLGLTFITSMKLFLGLTLILSGIFMYLFSKDLFKNKLAAFTAPIFYIFTPYHLIDLHFKVGVGELLTFTFIPLIFLFLHKLYVEKKVIFLALSSFSLALLFTSNALIAFFVDLLALAYVLFLGTKSLFNIKYLLRSLLIFIFTFILCAWIWAAPFVYNSYLYIKIHPLTIGYFPTIPDLLYAPWRMGFLFQGHRGEISNLIGYTQIFIVITVFVSFIFRKIAKNLRKDVIFWILMTIITIFLITSPSRFVWENLSFVKAAGSHRLLLILTFCVSIIAGYFSLIYRKKHLLVWGIIIVTIGYTILNWGHRRMMPEISDITMKKQLWKSTSEGEGHYYANTKWIDIKNPWFSKLPKTHLEIVSGTAQIKDVFRTSTHHRYIIDSKTPLKIQENTLYFPGWKGFINNKEISLYPSSKGIILTTIPQGHYTFELIYQDLFVYKLLKIISALSFIGISIFISLKLLRSYLP